MYILFSGRKGGRSPGVGTKFECFVSGNSTSFAPASAATDTGMIPNT